MSIKGSVFTAIIDSPALATALTLIGNTAVAVTAGFFVGDMQPDAVKWYDFYNKFSFWGLVAIIGAGSYFRHSISEATYEIIDTESARKHLLNRLVPKLGEYAEREIENGNLKSVDKVMEKIEDIE